MAAFVGSSSFVGSAVTARPAVASRSRAVPSRPATVSMAVKDFDKWKTEWAGGFPGGEGFFKDWLENGMKEDVPGLEKELQASNPKQGSSIVLPGPTPSEASVAAAAKLAGKPAPAPASETADGRAAEGSDAAASAGAAAASAEAAAEQAEKADAPSPSLYMDNYKYFPVNVAPVINITYDRYGPPADHGVSLAMSELSGNFAELYYPAQYKNKAPVITIDYVPGGEFTAGVGLAMDEIDGPPTVAPPAAKGEVTTTLSTDPYTGNLKLDFSVDGTDVNVYSDPRSIDAYEQMLAK